MDEDQKSSLLVHYIGMLLMIFITFGSLIWFGIYVVKIFGQLASTPPSITIYKGIFYMLGTGIGLGALLFGAMARDLNKIPLSDSAQRHIVKIAIFGIAVMFTLPHAADHFVTDYLENRKYVVCEEASHQWLHSKTIVFTKNRETCLQMAKKEGARLY